MPNYCKTCIKCKKEKELSEFCKNKNHKDGLHVWCIKCVSEYKKKYYQENKNKISKYKKKYQQKNKGKISKYKKKYQQNHKEKIAIHKKEQHKKFPWKRTLKSIKQRCNNKNSPDYYTYGGRGIKVLITEEEIKELWFRDKAYLMDRPSIDREDNDGNYEFSNCQFIEIRDNIGKDKRKPVLQFDLEGNFIKEWCSQHEAGRQLNVKQNEINACCRKTAGGFIWKNKGETIVEL